MSADTLAVRPVGTTEGPALDADARNAPEHDAPHGHAHDDDARDAREAAWVRALAEMESAADEAEGLLDVAHAQGVAAGTDADVPDVDVALTAPWRAPRGLGALPTALAPRAAALVLRQRDLVRRTAEQLDEHRRRLRTSDGLRTRAAAAPVYLDVEG